MATKPKTVKKKAASQVPKDYRVRIRMYRQGLGDCFLLSFPKGGGKHVHVMIDCGVVLGTGEPGVVMKEVAKDLIDETAGKIDVLAITHEHWDHLSGFTPGQAQKEFNGLKFENLWLAWTEEEGNALAAALREERKLKKAAAAATKKALEEAGGGKSKALNARVARLGAVLEFTGADGDGGEGAGGTSGALEFIKGKVPKSRTKTFHPGLTPLANVPDEVVQGRSPVAVPGLPEDSVRVYVMGPPENKKALGKLDPGKEGFPQGKKKGFGRELSLAGAYMAAFEKEDGELAQPFASSFRREKADLKRIMDVAERQELERLENELETLEASTYDGPSVPDSTDRSGTAWYVHPENAWRTIDEDWLAVGERLALQLDNDTNNTSLVLAFEFVETGDVLLFPGDAQAGNMLSWDKYRWQVKDKDGQKREVNAADLLRRTVFYKVGHHGSHNATLREKGLLRMESERIAAVIPVDVGVAHKVKGWKHMPLPEIVAELKSRCAVLFQSDQKPTELRKVEKTGWEPSKKTFEVKMTNKKTKKSETVRTEHLYYDYFL